MLISRQARFVKQRHWPAGGIRTEVTTQGSESGSKPSNHATLEVGERAAVPQEPAGYARWPCHKEEESEVYKDRETEITIARERRDRDNEMAVASGGS